MALIGQSLGALLGPAAASSRSADDGSPPKVLVVLDVSGSMHLAAGNKNTRLQAAREALAELVDTLPRRSSLGLRVYGATYAGKDRSVSCRDTQLLAPISPLDPEKVLGAASKLKPTGDTPIGLALKYAASDLKTSDEPGKPFIVLISDGQDNCSPRSTPPCQVVQALQHTGFKVRIETVGVALAGSRSATDELRCISEHTGGNYYDAEDSDALSAALERISSNALGGIGAGKPVRTTARRSQAVLISPGSYRIALRPGQVAWFRFRASDGQEPRVLTTVEGLESLRVPVGDRRCPAWSVHLYNPYGEGGSYPPYGNTAEFDGVGIGTTGASTTHKLDPYSKGIDFPGVWRLKLSLAEETLDACSQALPREHAFPARFSLQMGRPRVRGDATADDKNGSASARASAKPATDTSGEDPELKAKYDEPANPSDGPAWLSPVVSVLCAIGAAACGAWVLVLRRRRRRGW